MPARGAGVYNGAADEAATAPARPIGRQTPSEHA